MEWSRTGWKPWALTPEEVLLTWGHRTKEAVGCHGRHRRSQISLLCGFWWPLTPLRLGACSVPGEDAKKEKTSTRNAFLYQLFSWPQVITRSGLGKNAKICRPIGQDGAKLAAEDSAVGWSVLTGWCSPQTWSWPVTINHLHAAGSPMQKSRAELFCGSVVARDVSGAFTQTQRGTSL